MKKCLLLDTVNSEACSDIQFRGNDLLKKTVLPDKLQLRVGTLVNESGCLMQKLMLYNWPMNYLFAHLVYSFTAVDGIAGNIRG
jgi:hypothetical protein